MCPVFMVRNIAYHARKPHTIIHCSGALSATKSKFCGLRESLSFINVSAPFSCASTLCTLCSLHIFLPLQASPMCFFHQLTIHNKKRPLLGRALLSVIRYVALFFAFGGLAFGAFSLTKKLAFGDICGFISKSVDVQIVNI